MEKYVASNGINNGRIEVEGKRYSGWLELHKQLFVPNVYAKR